MPQAIYIGSDKRRLEARIWQDWLNSVAHISNKHMKFDEYCENGGKCYPVNPFSYNETASVSILVAAAQLAGMVAIADYVTLKAAKDGGKKDRYGRADLWLCYCANNKHWEFEFKRICAKLFKPETLKSMMLKSHEEAVSLLCEGETIKSRGMTPVGARIFYVEQEYNKHADEFDKLLGNFCNVKEIKDKIEGKERYWVRHGWKVVPHEGCNPTYFVFDVLQE